MESMRGRRVFVVAAFAAVVGACAQLPASTAPVALPPPLDGGAAVAVAVSSPDYQAAAPDKA